MTSSMMHPYLTPGFSRLSQEIIDEIIDHYFVLMEHRISTKACPLISRAFRDRSQKHLFTTLSLYMDHESQISREKFKRLNDVFSMNPRLASHVRVLELEVKNSMGLWNPCFEDRNFMECLAHISQIGIGQQPPHLEMDLREKRADSIRPITSSIPRSRAFENHVVPFIASRLTSMFIVYLRDVPVALFDTSHNLVNLHMEGITLAPFEDSKRGPIEQRPLIRELWVKASDSVVCNNCLRFDELSRVTFFDYDIMTARHILSSAPPSSLEYLQFDSEYEECDAHKYSEMDVDLSTLPNLRKMQLHVPFPLCVDGYPVASDECPVTSLVDLLRTCPTGHQIKHLGLNFDISLWITDLDEGFQMLEDVDELWNWAALDSVLVNMTNSITHVLKVEISFKCFIIWALGRRVSDSFSKKTTRKGNDYIQDWRRKCLPRITASDSPNLDLVEIRIDCVHEFHRDF